MGPSVQAADALLPAQRKTNQEIAWALNVTLNTATYHVKQVFARLGGHDSAAVSQVLSKNRHL